MEFEHQNRNRPEIVSAPEEGFNFAEGIAAYIQASEEQSTLRPHQMDVFSDLYSFFARGETRGYINLPTGTGKTVLFVELSKAVLEARRNGQAPRILVVTPTKDLVHQTKGVSGEKGYGRFAPDLKVGSYFSDSSTEDKATIVDQDVVVTTYSSFKKLYTEKEYRPVETAEDIAQAGLLRIGQSRANEESILKNVPTGRTLLSLFDVVVLDEAHHALGEVTRNIVNRLSPDTVVLGFTATPDIDESRQLSSILPNQIHDLALNEAIGLGLLAPIVPIGIKSDMKITGSDILDTSGEFIDSRVSYLARSPERNRRIIEVARVFAKQGIRGIISCLAGDEAWHARHLAEELSKVGVRAASVHSGISALARQEIYRQYNNHELDMLTFVGVLGEGWDSPFAKALINARPTRSQIFSKQRLGRITRPGGTAYVVDVCDDFDASNIPITGADVLQEGAISFGDTVGSVSDAQKIRTILTDIKQAVPVLPELECKAHDTAVWIAGLEKLHLGRLLDNEGRVEYALPTLVSSNYNGLTDEHVTKYEEITGVHIDKKMAAKGKNARIVYNVRDAARMMYAFPTVDPGRYFVDADNEKWISPQGLMQLFGKRYPDITADIIDEALKVAGSELDWRPAKYLSRPDRKDVRHYRMIKLYHASKDMTTVLDAALQQYFA